MIKSGDAGRGGPRIRRMEKRVTMRDVAQAAGVSPTTVSHVLNNRQAERYPDSTRERVLETVRRLNFTPHAGARSIGLRKFQSMGLVVGTDLAYQYLPNDLLHGVAETLLTAGYRLNILQLPEKSMAIPEVLPALYREWHVDGLISNYAAPTLPTAWNELIDHHKVPVVYLNSDGCYPVVRPDDIRAGEVAVERLVERGHRRIAYVGRPESSHYSVAQRLQGWSRACRRLSLPVPPAWLHDAEHLTATEWAVRLSAPGAGKQPTAIVYYGWACWMDFHRHLQETRTEWKPCAEICVDLKVASYSPLPFGLDAITFDWHAIGAKAAGMLVDMIAAAERGDAAYTPPREMLQPPD